uniref:Uncharacterized protein n=1 Tax=mine drainage metagenome TaxID=410659 RepID=E6PNV4_9ZZZZ
MNPPAGAAAGALLDALTLLTVDKVGALELPPPPQPARANALANASAVQMG